MVDQGAAAGSAQLLGGRRRRELGGAASAAAPVVDSARRGPEESRRPASRGRGWARGKGGRGGGERNRGARSRIRPARPSRQPFICPHALFPLRGKVPAGHPPFRRTNRNAFYPFPRRLNSTARVIAPPRRAQRFYRRTGHNRCAGVRVNNFGEISPKFRKFFRFR